MYLNGKVFLRIDKFDQDRKFMVFSGMGSCEFFSFDKDVLKESVSFVLSTVHVAWARRVTEKFPGFCQNISVIFFSVLCLELCAAPEIIRDMLPPLILKWGLPARLPFRAKLKQAIPACPAVLFYPVTDLFCAIMHIFYIFFFLLSEY